MFAGNLRRQSNRPKFNKVRSCKPCLIEALEERQLLSAAVADKALQPSVAASGLVGYTPAHILQAYQMNQITFGGTRGQGQGQTIAIVEPGDDPNIQGDLQVFDEQFGLPVPPNFSVVNQTGGTSLPSPDLVGSDTTAFDVEWAHALAPQANILLVETNETGISDLFAGARFAAGAPGVSVVCMTVSVAPWAGFNQDFNEFFNEAADDSTFTTPAGHQGVTFIAAAGDSTGTLNYPAASPNVLSVGGTTLTADANGNYQSETSWSGTAAGQSLFETELSYQSTAQNTGKREVADVSWDAAGSPGFDVYNSYFPTFNGWEALQGTAGGAIGWGALIAIADQGRAVAGLPTLDGVTDTLPDLYQLYGAPNTAGYSTYTTYFHDIQDSGIGGATAGYDTVTGLGTPIAPKIAAYLSTAHHNGGGPGGGGPGGGGPGGGTGPGGGAPGGGAGSGLNGLHGLGHLPITQNGGGSNNSGGGSQSGGSHNNPPPAQVLPPILPSVSLAGEFLTSLSGQLVSGKAQTLSLELTNSGSLRFSGPVEFHLSAVDANSNSTPLGMVKVGKLKVNANGTKLVKFHFKIPKGFPAGAYTIEASAMAVKDNLMVLQPLVAGMVTIIG